MSKIVSLTAENVKRISAVHIVPGDDGVVLIGGRNAQGKSSVLDSIMMALAGASTIPDEPIRRGEESAEVTVDLGEIVVRRRFTKSGSTVTVKTKDKASYSSPQKVLDGLFSKLSFDPLKFSMMKPDEQAKTLIELVGIDTADLDKSRAKTFEDRTVVNRLVKEAEVALSLFPAVDVDVPEVRPDVDAVRDRIRNAESASRARDAVAGSIERLKAVESELIGDLDSLKREAEQIGPEWDAAIVGAKDRADQCAEIAKARHERELADLLKRHSEELDRITQGCREDEQRIIKAQSDAKVKNQSDTQWTEEELVRVRGELSALVEGPSELIETVEDLQAELNQTVKTAEAFDHMTVRREKEALLKSRQDEADALTKKLDDIAAQKREKLAKAKYPIDGLSVSEDGTVLFDGIPFSQASRAQKIRTSVSIGLAMNPKLKVLLIQDGSLLDDDGLALVAEMAAQHDAQIWIERVGDKDESAIIIEDGHVRLPDPEPVADLVSSVLSDEPVPVEKPARKKRAKAAAVAAE